MLSDTHPDAKKLQAELLCKATPEARLEMALSLTATAINLSCQTIADQYPDLDQQARNLMWIELHYGKELAARIREYLRKEVKADGP